MYLDTFGMIIGYIDPNTMHHVFTFFGTIAAFFAGGLGVIVSAVYFLRHHLRSWCKKMSRLKLFVSLLAVILILTIITVAVIKFILPLVVK
ncbi:hypothetical protein ACFL3G_08750 [Planctomycetota bacterium]